MAPPQLDITKGKMAGERKTFLPDTVLLLNICATKYLRGPNLILGLNLNICVARKTFLGIFSNICVRLQHQNNVSARYRTWHLQHVVHGMDPVLDSSPTVAVLRNM